MQIPETEIIVIKDGAEILRKTVRPGDYVIGREPGCEVHLDVESVSPRHAQLIVNFDHALIEDLGSSNGTFVNSERVKECTRLWPNQKIQIGSATVELHRVKSARLPDVSLPPHAAAMQRLLPEEFLRERKYDIGKIVAQGGMGAILDAREATTERRVAMKVMLDGSSPDDLTRFIAEAKVTAQLEHPNVVPVHELSIDENGQPFYTMKMVRGVTLRKVLELLAKGDAETLRKYPLPDLLTIFRKVCDAIAFAHSKGVIHRDLKPENIMLGDFGEVLVMDWGLAKVIGQKRAPAENGMRSLVRSLPPEASAPTLAGTVMGTPQYMSPEQARGEVEDLDGRSDIYALGAILYHLLSLRPPVRGKDAWVLISKVADGHVEPLTAPMGRPIPDSIAAVVRKAMSFDRDERYPHVAELQRDIEAYQNGRATRAENAGLGKQLLLLVRRHKALFVAAFVAWLIITALTAWFVVNVTHAKNQAESQRNAALRERARSDALLTKTQLEQAEALFDAEDASGGLAYLATVLRRHPEDSATASRVLSALRDRSWFLPVTGLLPQGSTIRTLSISPDGRKLATFGPSGLRIWDMRDGRLLGQTAALPVPVDDQEAKAPSSPRDIAWSPDGRKIAILHSAGQVLDAETLQPLIQDILPNQEPHFIEWEGDPSVAWSPDGHWLFAATRRSGGRVWDMTAGRLCPSASIYKPGGVSEASWNPSSNVLLFFDNGRAITWEAGSDRFAYQLWDKSRILGVTWNFDGSRLLTWTVEGEVQTWNPATRQLAAPSLVHFAPLGVVAPDPTGRFIATATSDGTLRIWEAATGRLHGAPIPHNGWIGLEWSGDGARLKIESTASGTVFIRDSNSLELLGQGLSGVGQLSPDGARLAMISPNGMAQVWNASFGQSLPQRFPHGSTCVAAAFSPDGKSVATAGDLRTRIWNRSNGKLTVELAHEREVHALAWRPKGGILATGSNALQLWNPSDGAKKGRPLTIGEHINSVGFSADGDVVFATGAGKRAAVWQTGSGAVRATMSVPLARGGRMNRSGTRLLLGATEGWIRMYDTSSGNPLPWRLEHTGVLTSFNFSPDERWIVSGANAMTGAEIQIWSAETGESIAPSVHTSSTIWDVAFSPDSMRIVTSDERGGQLWSAPGLEPIGARLATGALTYQSSFGPHSNRLATIALDTARLWDAASGRPITERFRHSWENDGTVAVRDEYYFHPLRDRLYFGGKMGFVEFSHDGGSLLTVSDHGTALLWETPPVGAAPRWLADLAEAVAGRRMDDRGVLAPVSADELTMARERVASESGNDVFARTARWFFQDRGARPISPSATTTVREYVSALMEEGSLSAVLLARRLEPGAPDIGAALAAANADYSSRAKLLKENPSSLPTLLSILRIPPRDPQANGALIDLSAHYTHGLDSHEWMGEPLNNLAALPRGVQQLDGTDFDIRGIIQLFGKAPWQNQSWPEAARGIVVGRVCKLIHFLHAACYVGDPKEKPIGAYLVHYSDGSEATVPIVQGRDVFDWDPAKPIGGLNVAWQGYKRRNGKDVKIFLFKSTWKNPHPELQVETIDFISRKEEAAPFLVAMTAE